MKMKSKQSYFQADGTPSARILAGLGLLALLCLASLSARSQGLEDPIPEVIGPGDVDIELVEVASGFVSPLHGAAAPGDNRRLFIVDQVGILYAVNFVTGEVTPFLDVSDRIVLNIGAYDERGLLGMAFDPAYASNGYLYTYTSEPSDGPADFPWSGSVDHQTVIARWQVPQPADRASVVDTGSRKELLRIDQPARFHQGGTLAFDNTGMLLIALGNGGPLGTGQDNSNPLGSVLRIDPAGTNSSNGQYGIPADNPFVGDAGVVEEIFASGFRNPFRISVDPVTGNIWGSDVGNNDIEEVNQIRAGENYGFDRKEGSFCFIGMSGPPTGAPGVADPSECDSTGLTDPFAEYDHDEGVAVIGGYIYRGVGVPELAGRYVFGDFSQVFTSPEARLFYLDGSTILELNLPGPPGFHLLGFARDNAGEVYALGNGSGRTSGETGTVFRISPDAGNAAADVEINIRPGGWGNVIRPASWMEYVPVAVLTTSVARGDATDFDALQVNPWSVRFGPGGTRWSNSGAWPSWIYVRDVDRDGDRDLLMYFQTGFTGIRCGSVEAPLTGETWSDVVVAGQDYIATEGCSAE